MGISQSTHEFVEPLAFGFEDDLKIDKFTVIPIGEEPKTIRRDACHTCIQRSRQLIKKEETIHKHLRTTELSYLRSAERKEAAELELQAAVPHLEYVSEQYRISTLDNEKAPMHLRRRLKEGHQRRRIAIMTHEHAVSRLKRKEKSLKNIVNLYEEAKKRTISGLNMQMKCSLNRSRVKNS